MSEAAATMTRARRSMRMRRRRRRRRRRFHARKRRNPESGRRMRPERKKMKGIAQSNSKRRWIGCVNFPHEITQPRSFSRKPLHRGELGGHGGRGGGGFRHREMHIGERIGDDGGGAGINFLRAMPPRTEWKRLCTLRDLRRSIVEGKIHWTSKENVS